MKQIYNYLIVAIIIAGIFGYFIFGSKDSVYRKNTLEGIGYIWSTQDKTTFAKSGLNITNNVCPLKAKDFNKCAIKTLSAAMSYKTYALITASTDDNFATYKTKSGVIKNTTPAQIKAIKLSNTKCLAGICINDKPSTETCTGPELTSFTAKNANLLGAFACNGTKTNDIAKYVCSGVKSAGLATNVTYATGKTGETFFKYLLGYNNAYCAKY
jgi:hypothetical protein